MPGSETPTGREPTPPVSVWVLAFGRRPSLRRALDSLAAQRCPAGSFEVLVLSDLAPDERFEGFPSEWRWLRLPTAPMGTWFAPALPASRGELIALLDDDDAFDPAKIGWVLETFQTHPETTYAHHGWRRVSLGDGTSPDTRGPSVDRLPPALRVSDAGKTSASIERLWAGGAAFNQTCTVVRRSLIEGLLDELARTAGGVCTLLLFGALSGRGEIVNDPRPLTDFGVHPRSRSPDGASDRSEAWRRRIRIADDRWKDAETALALVSRRRPALPTAPLLRARNEYRLLAGLADPSVARAEIARRWVAVFRQGALQGWGRVGVEAALGGVRCAWPAAFQELGRGLSGVRIGPTGEDG